MSVRETHMTDAQFKAQRELKVPEPGPKRKELEIYVKDKLPNAHVKCMPGDVTVPDSLFQIMIIKRGLRTAVEGPNSITVSTFNVSSIEEGSRSILDWLKSEESTGLAELNEYVEKNFKEQGFEVNNRRTESKHSFAKYEVSVKLNSEASNEHGHFILGVDCGPSVGIAARKVLDLIKFKEKNGFLWVDDEVFFTLFKFAKKRAVLKEQLRWCKEQKMKELSQQEKEDKEFCENNIRKKLKETVTWLGQPFKGEPDFFKGELPKLSSKLHKALQKASKNKDGTEDKANKYLTYDAVRLYEDIQKKKVQEKETNSVAAKLKSTLTIDKKKDNDTSNRAGKGGKKK